VLVAVAQAQLALPVPAQVLRGERVSQSVSTGLPLFTAAVAAAGVVLEALEGLAAAGLGRQDQETLVAGMTTLAVVAVALTMSLVRLQVLVVLVWSTSATPSRNILNKTLHIEST
jgi:hypothetical protein